MNFSEAPPFHLLGNIVAVGVIIALVLSLSFVPALMMALPVKVRPRPEKTGVMMDHVASFTIKHRRPLFIVSLAIVIGLTSFIPKNEFNDSFHKYFDQTIEFRRATDFAIENLTGVYLIDYSIESSGEGEVNEPA